MKLPRILIPAFGLVAIAGAALASGRFGEGGLQLAIGITLLVTGALGVLNTIFFTRLKASLDRMVEERKGE
ncbi:MAG: hypothetical protein ABL308_11925 [Oceanicaulis sp.]